MVKKKKKKILELGSQRLLLVSENIFSQNIFLPTTQGPDMKNIFWGV